MSASTLFRSSEIPKPTTHPIWTPLLVDGEYYYASFEVKSGSEVGYTFFLTNLATVWVSTLIGKELRQYKEVRTLFFA